MSPIRFASSVLLVAGLGTSLSASACNCLPLVENAWLRLPPVSMPMLAGFARIENRCHEGVAIVGARSDAFGDVSLHETRVVDGISRMRAVPALPVRAGGGATLEPGGLHLMLMQPTRALKPGEKVAVEFLLRDGRAVRGEFVVRRAGE